jgi:hypothetical protein
MNSENERINIKIVKSSKLLLRIKYLTLSQANFLLKFNKTMLQFLCERIPGIFWIGIIQKLIWFPVKMHKDMILLPCWTKKNASTSFVSIPNG